MCSIRHKVWQDCGPASSLLFSLVYNHPNTGQATNRPGLRRVIPTPYPYVIFYRIAENEIVVLWFRHAARKPLSSS